jgi:hypothetical protein
MVFNFCTERSYEKQGKDSLSWAALMKFKPRLSYYWNPFYCRKGQYRKYC